MKRCPKCNRTYSTDTQKFCTHDGGLLFMIEDDLDKTVQFDSSKVRDAVSKPTTRGLDEQMPAQFDPEATVVSSASAGNVAQPPPPPPVRARDTGSLSQPQPTQHAISLPPQVTAPPPPTAPPSESAAPPAPPSMAPPPPPQTSAPLPPTQVVSGPIEPAAPVQAPPSGPITPPPPVAAAHPSQPLPPKAALAKKRSKLPLILGLVAVVLVFFVGVAVVAAYLLVIRPRQAQTTQPAIATAPAQPEPGLPTTAATPSEAAKPPNEPPPYSPPADAEQFVNSKDELSGRLAENFVAFNFYYPNRWVKVPSAENFVTVERRLPPDFTQERFGVAPWYAPSDTTTFDNAFFETLVAKDDANFAKTYPEYRKVSDGPVKVGSYDGYELRFESTSRGTDKGDLTIWGREIFFPPREGEKTGVKFLILTTSLAPELKSMDDVGVKGELPMLLESFRFGK